MITDKNSITAWKLSIVAAGVNDVTSIIPVYDKAGGPDYQLKQRPDALV